MASDLHIWRLPYDSSLDPPHEDESEGMKQDLIDDVESASSDIDEYVNELRDKLYDMEGALDDALASRDRIEELLDAIGGSTGDLDKSIERNQ